MRSTSLIVALALATTAQAQITVQLLWSESGINQAITETGPMDFLPFWDGFNDTGDTYEFNGPSFTGRLFLFARFDGPGIVPFDTKIIGMQLDIGGDAPADDGIVYRQRKTTGPLATRWNRWDGANPIPLDGGIMAAVTSNGILILDNDNYIPGIDIFDLGTGRTFLIGSVMVTDALAGQTLTAGPGPLGAEMKVGASPSFQATIIGDTVTFVPEPASGLGVATLALLLRRR